jgi:AraC family transcriptional regulator
MQYLRVQKSAHRPMAADAALDAAPAAVRVIDVAVDDAEFPEHPNPHLKIAVVLDARRLDFAWQSASGRTERGRAAPGSASVMPAQMPYTTCWRGAGRMLLLSFSPDFLRARDEAVGRRASELRPAWSQSDPLLAQLASTLLAAQRAGDVGTAYFDAAAEFTMAHLLHRYGAAAQRPQNDHGLMPANVARVLEAIDAHLGENLSQQRLAAIAGMSSYGFARAFTRAVGEPPHRYVARRRCERARQLLANPHASIADIASALGFSSQAHLTTAFSRAWGTTPARYRAHALRA